MGYAFVDNTNLVQTVRSQDETINDVMSKMQKSMDMWEGLIKATGGALLAEKCCWWAIDFKWHSNGSWAYASIDDAPGPLEAMDYDGTRKLVQRLEVTEAFETLGVFIVPDGGQAAAFRSLMDKAMAWANRL